MGRHVQDLVAGLDCHDEHTAKSDERGANIARALHCPPEWGE